MKLIIHLNLSLYFCLLAPGLWAQPVPDCAGQLEVAKRLYDQGRLPEVVRSLETCAWATTVSRPLRREILSLLQEAYLFLDDDLMSDSVHLELLRLDPFFTQNVDIPEVRYLVDQYETYPVATYGVRLGIYTFTRPLIEREFTAFPGLNVQELSYKRRSDDLYGWTVNADISFNLFKSSVEIASGIGISSIYLRRNFQFANARLSSGDGQAPAAMSFLERQRWTQIPLLLQINALPRSEIIHSRFVPYFFAGGTLEFLIRRTAQAVGPEIDFPGVADDRSASLIALSDQRRRFNFALLIGMGGKYRFKRTYLLLDVRYHRLLQSVVRDENRFSNEELLNTFNYVDHDFRISQVNFNVGIGVFLFRSKRR